MPIDRIEIDGELEAQRKLEQVITDLRGRPFLSAMQNAAAGVASDAKRLAPVDTGRLRASITPEVRMDGDVVLGVVGTVVKYAAAMELGTRPHFPPVSALEVWAQRHGVNAFAVARAISKRGLQPRRYLQGALEKNQGRIVRIIGEAVGRIVLK